MNPKAKAILLVTVSFAALLLAIWGLNHWLIQPAFNQLEQAAALEESSRARAAIQWELRQLNGVAGDWAEWDETSPCKVS